MNADEIIQRILVEGEGKIGLKVAKAAELVDCKKSLMYELVAKQKVRAVRIGREMRIPISELVRLITEGTNDE